MALRKAWASTGLYPLHGLAALVRLLGDDGIAAGVTLRGTGLDAAALADAAAPVSGETYLQACLNAAAATADSALALRLGARLRPADGGVFGLLLLSCASLHEGLLLAARYQQLAPYLLPIDTAETADAAGWSLSDAAADPWQRELVVFVTELQVAQLLAGVREVLGDDTCRPALVRIGYPAPPHRALYERHLGCPVVFDARRTEIRYPRTLLARRPRLANARAAAVLRSACERMRAEIDASAGVAGQVYRALLHRRDAGAGMKAVAAALKMTDRTLRRRLADEGTSFTAISHQVRFGVATQYLEESRASIEQIAAATGFSDPSNFRRAFVRWTSMSPAQFRRLRHP